MAPTLACQALLDTLKADGILEDVAEVVRRLRRTPGAWKLIRQDLEESERRKSPGCARYELHHDRQGIVGVVKPLGVWQKGSRRS